MNISRTRQRSFDLSQTLTYRKVIDRIRKRFLLHKQREEQEEIRERDFEELKQDIQMLRFELLNRMDDVRDDLSAHGQLLNQGVVLIGELLSSSKSETNDLMEEKLRQLKTNVQSTADKKRQSSTSLTKFSIRSMLCFDEQLDQSASTAKIDRHFSLTNIKLSNIPEEDQRLRQEIKFIDEE